MKKLLFVLAVVMTIASNASGQNNQIPDSLKTLIKPTKNFTVGDTELKIIKTQITSEVKYNLHEGEWDVNKADKDQMFVSVIVTITSENKNPKLPQLYLYSIDNNKATLIEEAGLMYYFASWDSYGSYLGNYHDNGNDFAKSNSISFVAFGKIKKSDIAKPFVIVSSTSNCVIRMEIKHLTPKTHYLGSCPAVKSASIDELINNYIVIEVYEPGAKDVRRKSKKEK